MNQSSAAVLVGFLLGGLLTLGRGVLAAARAVAGEVSPSSVRAGCVYPEMEDLRPVSRAVALAVAQAGISEGVAEGGLESTDAEAVAARVDAHMWVPDYLPYRDEPDA